MRTSGRIVYPGKGKVLSIHKTKAAFYQKRVFYILLALFVLGLMYGSILLKSGNTALLERLATIQNVAVANKVNQSFGITFVHSLFSSGIFVLLAFLLGFSAVTQPATFLIVFVKGLGLGSSIGYFYLNYGLAGVGYSALVIMPGAVISTFALILSARESVALSNLLFFSFTKEENGCNKSTLKLYLLKHLILGAFVLASSFLDAVMALIFAGIFRFG